MKGIIRLNICLHFLSVNNAKSVFYLTTYLFCLVCAKIKQYISLLQCKNKKIKLS